MALQVWLPLNGDLHNQGLSGLTATNNGTTINNNGKIGKCYSFNGSSQKISINNISPAITSVVGSLACWVKFNSLPSSSGWFCLMQLGALGGFAACRLGVYFEKATGINISINGSTTGANYQAYTFSTGVWYHICATYDGSKVKLYINGQEKMNKNATLGSYTTAASNLFIGGTHSYWINGYMNDIRFYDHALSAAEVAEIAKGLVLHYKLDDRFCEATTNLVTGLTSGRQTTVSNNIVTTSGTNADTYFTVNLSENIANGTQYTIQCYAEMPIGTTWTFPIGSQSNSSLSWILKPGYNEYTFTANDISWGTKRIFLDDLSGSARISGVQCKFYNFQLEKKNHATGFAGYGATRSPTTIYDSSGYSHNGTIVGKLTAAAGSPRYDVATQFPGNAFIEAEPLPATTLTISAWVNFTDTSGSAYRMVLHDKNSGLAIGYYSSSIITYVGSAAGGTGSKVIANLTANTWYHIVVVKTGDTTRDTYINGEKATVTSNNWWGGDLTKFNIGCCHVSGSYSAYTTGKIVDVRAYTTALTVDQIKELYNTSMSIDANGNVHARELVE